MTTGVRIMKGKFLAIIITFLGIAGICIIIGVIKSKKKSDLLQDNKNELPSQEFSSRVVSIVKKLSLEEKIGQLCQMNVDSFLTQPDKNVNSTSLAKFGKKSIGAYFNSPFSGGPVNGKVGWTAKDWRKVITQVQTAATENGGIPVLFGVDSLHGANYVYNATLLGQQINAGATFNADLAYAYGRLTGKDSMAAGIPWIFAPVLDITTQYSWARVYETFGEDPHLVTVLGTQMVKGIQSNKNVAACVKHFIGYSNPQGGQDRADVNIPDWELLNYFAPPFIEAVNAGALTVMEGYSSLNGIPIIASSKYMNDLLRNDMKFGGMVVSDYDEIYHLHLHHKVSPTKEDSVLEAYSKTSVDMSMTPYDDDFIDTLLKHVRNGKILESRVDTSVMRVIDTKINLGLFENPVPGKHLIDTVGSDEDVKIALNLARESITLVKNDNGILPLTPGGSTRILVTGPASNSIGYLCSGWTHTWQGDTNNAHYARGVTIPKALEAIGKVEVDFALGVDIEGKPVDIDVGLAKAKQATYTIVVLGEKPYTEKVGDIPDLSLPKGQLEYVEALLKTDTKVILVLVQGRPRLLNGLAEKVHAILLAFLPCEQGGQAIAEIIYGKVNPSGKLPYTYPKFSGVANIPYYHKQSTMCDGFPECPSEWKFGFGLGYSTFSYSQLTLNATDIMETDTLRVQVKVSNTGKMTGKEVVMLFLSKPYRKPYAPEVKMLKAFKKIELKPGESQMVSMILNKKSWGFYEPTIGSGLTTIVFPGVYYLSIGHNTECNMYDFEDKDTDRFHIHKKEKLAAPNPLCSKFTINSKEDV